MIFIEHRLSPATVLGIVRAEGIHTAEEPPGFEDGLHALLEVRQAELSPEEERVRKAARDMLRNGRYKPTGRGKPASEYLIRAARQAHGDARPEHASFPRINAPVDVCNFISLKYVVPISLWDLDRAGADRFLFRLGSPGESYVFNEGGQEIELQDLVVGCRLGSAGGRAAAEPIVNPVRDSLATKTTPETTRVAACVYAPREAFSDERLRAVCGEFAGLLAGCGSAPEVAHGLVSAGGSGEV